MTRDGFEDQARREGYGPPREVSFQPLSRSATHGHDMISLVYVVAGQFILNTAAGSPSYGPGQSCILDKDIDHAEEAGPDGATILVARK